MISLKRVVNQWTHNVQCVVHLRFNKWRWSNVKMFLTDAAVSVSTERFCFTALCCHKLVRLLVSYVIWHINTTQNSLNVFTSSKGRRLHYHRVFSSFGSSVCQITTIRLGDSHRHLCTLTQLFTHIIRHFKKQHSKDQINKLMKQKSQNQFFLNQLC